MLLGSPSGSRHAKFASINAYPALRLQITDFPYLDSLLEKIVKKLENVLTSHLSSASSTASGNRSSS